MLPGTGPESDASNARSTGFLTPTVSASPFPISVPLTITPEPAHNVLLAITLKMGDAFSLQSKKSLMLAVLLGTGLESDAWNAQNTGFSTLTESAFLFLTNVQLMTLLEPALNAIKAIILTMVNASKLPFRRFLMWAVLLGIGITKSASDALTDGSSTPIEFVFQFPISVQPSRVWETATVATRVIICKMGAVFRLLFSKFQMLAALLGTGIISCAFSALTDGSSIPIEFAYPSLIIVRPGTILEPVLLATMATF